MNVVTISRKELKELVREENLLPFNRNISTKHIDKMAKSISECGILRLPVIGVIKSQKNKKAIIDGQHLVKSVLRDPNIKELQCILKDYEGKRDVIADVSKLNNTQKVWNDYDFLNAWYRFGIDDFSHHQNYAYLMEKYSRYDISCGVLVGLYAKSKNDFKLGKLEFKDLELSNKTLSVVDILKSEFKMPAHALEGLIKWVFGRQHKGTDFSKLESRLFHSLRTGQISHKISRDEFMDELTKIYTRL
tara:strand:- start:60 stop:800 length:741 start_codon:yes stop_codon:yes gene_type:complete